MSEKQVSGILGRVNRFKGAITEEYNALGGLLRCRQCGHEQALHDGDAGRYLFNGWPEHCGYTMTWVTQRQLDAESEERT